MLSETWNAVDLGQVLTLQRGFDLPYRLRHPGKIPIVTSSGITDSHDVARVKGPGVVTGRYGTIGQVFFITSDFWPHNTTLYVKDFKGNDPLFISYLLRTIDFDSHSGKSGVPGVNRNDLHALTVRLPMPDEQRAIAGALSDMDALISALDKVIAKKRAIKLAAIQRLLTGRTRLPGFSDPWEEKAFGHVLKVRHGRSQQKVVSPAGAYPIFGTSGVLGFASEFLYDQPSVLIGRKGTIDMPQYTDKPFWSIDTLFYTEIKPEADAKFIYYRFLMVNWAALNEASGVPSLNASNIEAQLFRCPTLREQKAIADVLSGMDAEIAALERHRKKTTDIKQGMMQTLLTAGIRLLKPEAEPAR